MSDLSGTNILIIIPKSQFCGQELNGVRTILQQCGANVVVLSKSGQEARGMNKEKFQPDGMIVDWNKQPGIEGKYHAVILVGGKGAKKFLGRSNHSSNSYRSLSCRASYWSYGIGTGCVSKSWVSYR